MRWRCSLVCFEIVTTLMYTDSDNPQLSMALHGNPGPAYADVAPAFGEMRRVCVVLQDDVTTQ